MWNRIAIAAALAAFAFLAFASGVDRMSIANPALERLVPEPFRAQSAIATAATALARGQDNALPLAEEAVRAAPVEARALALLGSARAVAGDAQGTDAAFRAAALLGWREPATQIYWMEVAKAAGDWPNAMLRADAILRGNPRYREIGQLLAPFADDAEGRRALVDRLAEAPNWRTFYLEPIDFPELDELRRRARVGRVLATRTEGGSCEQGTRLAQLLVDRGARAEAASYWDAYCPGASVQGGLADGGFDAGDGQVFGWRRHPTGDIAVRYEGTGDARRLSVNNRSRMTRLAASQPIALAGGERINLAGEVTGPAADRAIVVTVACEGRPVPPTADAPILNERGQSITVPSNCPQPVLGLWARPDVGSVAIDNLSMTVR